jgi:DNA primase
VPRQADGGRHDPAVRSQHGTAGGYDPRDPVINLERQALKLAVQRPALCGPVFDALDSAAFSSPVHQRVKELIAGCGGVAGAGPAREWAERLLAAAPNDNARAFVTRLAVEPVEAPGPDGEPDARYADGVLAQVEELAVSRDIAVVKSRLQRMSPVAEQREYNRLFGDLVSLEQRRKQLLDRVAGVP